MTTAPTATSTPTYPLAAPVQPLPTLTAPAKPPRLASLDAYRGLIMVTLMGGGFGFARMARANPDDPFWQRLAFHTTHPQWISNVEMPFIGLPLGVSYWDLIMPAFLFMVGVAMPYSYARRRDQGESPFKSFNHVLIRSLVLILLGIFLQSRNRPETNWIFTNVLSQIGLGYTFAWLLMGRGWKLQLTACAAILAATFAAFLAYRLPDDPQIIKSLGGDAAHLAALPGSYLATQPDIWKFWIPGANLGIAVDRWLLNLFPRPTAFIHHQYATINFVPSIVTMIFGIMCGELLRSNRSPRRILALFIGSGVALIALGFALSPLVPIVKKLWTPSWTLFSGGYVILILAAFYFLCDVMQLRRWAFPLIVVGTNSILAYLMHQLITGWTRDTLKIHFGKDVFSGAYAPIIEALSVLLVFWLILYWLYRQKVFVRI